MNGIKKIYDDYDGEQVVVAYEAGGYYLVKYFYWNNDYCWVLGRNRYVGNIGYYDRFSLDNINHNINQLKKNLDDGKWLCGITYKCGIGLLKTLNKKEEA